VKNENKEKTMSGEVFKLDHPISCHAWNKDRSQLALSPDTNEVFVCKRDANKEWVPSVVLSQHELRITSIDWAPNTNRIVTASMDRNAYVWTQAADGQWKQELVLLRINRAATSVKWSPQENKFAVGTGSRLIAVCYFEQEHKWWVSKHIKKPIRSTILSVDWHPNNMLLVAGATDFRVRVFSTYLKEVDEKPAATAWGDKTTFGHMLAEVKNSPSGGGWVLDVNFSADGSKICWVGRDSSVNVAVAGDPPVVVKLKTSLLPFECCLWVAPNRILCSGHTCNPTVYDFNNGTLALHAFLDREEGGGAKKVNIMNIWKNKALTNETEIISKSLLTIHQTSIKGQVLFAGDKSKAKKVSTSAMDQQLVVWDLDKMTAIKK
jgi:actin related protein 2/3 complex, subunit 1A/1B